MTRAIIARIVATAACMAAIVAGGSVASAETSVIGAEGQVLRVIAGNYGELFPGGTDAAAESRVLALEVRAAEGGSELLLVPETASQAAESMPALIYERTTGTAYLLWQGTLGLVHSVLHLTSYDSEGWGPVLEITGNPFTRKVAPQLHVIRDSYNGTETNGTETVERTVIHVSWGEETAGGTIKRWTPIVIENGVHLAWMPTWTLDDFLADPAGDTVLGDYHSALRLQAGSKDNAAVVGYLTENGDRIGVLDLELLPRELEVLADSARWALQPDGALFDGEEDLADAVRQALAASGEGFHPATLAFIADRIGDLIASAGELTPAALSEIADQARWVALNDGARLGIHGLDDEAPFTILEVDRPDDPESHHLLKVTVRSLRDAPAGIGAEPKLYLSDHGTDVIVAWQSEGMVHYVESVEDGWSETRSIVLGDSLDAPGVESMLEARLASR